MYLIWFRNSHGTRNLPEISCAAFAAVYMTDFSDLSITYPSDSNIFIPLGPAIELFAPESSKH